MGRERERGILCDIEGLIVIKDELGTELIEILY